MATLGGFKSSKAKEWSADLWDRLMDALDARFGPLEEQLDIQRATTDAIVRRGLTVIEELLAPQVTNAGELLGDIEDQKAAAIALVAAIQALLDAYSSNHLSADLIDETASRLFLTPTLKAIYDAKATPADIAAAIDALKGGVGSAYDTLVEIAAKLNDDDAALASILTTLGTLGAAATKALATTAEIRANTNANVITTDKAWDASKWVSLGNISGSVTINASTGCRFYGTLTGNVTIDVSNLKDGQPLEIILVQDATGSRTVGWASKFKWPGAQVPGVTTTANTIAVVASCEGTWDANIVIGAGWKVT